MNTKQKSENEFDKIELKSLEQVFIKLEKVFFFLELEKVFNFEISNFL